MSGGSFNYLYVNGKPEVPGELVRMAEEAEALGFERGAAALHRMIEAVAKVVGQWGDLEEFMVAFEWMVSADWSRDTAREAERRLPEQIKVVKTAADLEAMKA
ncbi:MAG TPA: hypothetical protein VGV69_08385 [Solirubrobacterales bacterium]|nr:hypothetical protein [Solirubrobacterales bacterium]